jgi:hypothetical protein
MARVLFLVQTWDCFSSSQPRIVSSQLLPGVLFSEVNITKMWYKSFIFINFHQQCVSSMSVLSVHLYDFTSSGYKQSNYIKHTWELYHLERCNKYTFGMNRYERISFICPWKNYSFLCSFFMRSIVFNSRTCQTSTAWSKSSARW